MTHDEFEALHGECAKALGDYTKAATALCRLLGELAERTPITSHVLKEDGTLSRGVFKNLTDTF